MSRVCDMLLNSPSSFSNLLRMDSAQEASGISLPHIQGIDSSSVVGTCRTTCLSPLSFRNRTLHIRNQTRHDIIISSIPQHQTQRHEI